MDSRPSECGEGGEDLLREQVERRFDIASNEASAELRELGSSSLPTIESALSSELSLSDESEDPTRTFPGLPDVLITYFDMARAHDIRFAEQMLRSLPPHLQIYALGAIWSIWVGRSKAGSIPESLLAAIRELAGSDTPKSSEKAHALLAAYSAFGPRKSRSPIE